MNKEDFIFYLKAMIKFHEENLLHEEDIYARGLIKGEIIAYKHILEYYTSF